MSGWTTHEEVQAEDEVPPELTASGVYSRQWVYDRGDGLFGVATVKFYCEDRWGHGGARDAVQPGYVSEGPKERYCVGQELELVVCPDPEDPGKDALWLELLYRNSEAVFPEPLPDEHVRAVMAAYKTRYLHWDATAIYGSAAWNLLGTLAEPISPESWSKILPYEVKRWIADTGWAWL